MMEHWYWVWAVLLLALGMGLAVLEVFFPSAGVLGFLSVTAMVGAIIMGFMQGPGTGLAILAVAAVGLPTIIVLAFRWWPETKMGKQVLLAAPKAEDVLPDDPDRRHLKGLIGHVGRTKCPMFPGGVIAIDGRTVDAVSEGMAIEAGQRGPRHQGAGQSGGGPSGQGRNALGDRRRPPPTAHRLRPPRSLRTSPRLTADPIGRKSWGRSVVVASRLGIHTGGSHALSRPARYRTIPCKSS